MTTEPTGAELDPTTGVDPTPGHVAHPITGEVLDLTELAPDTLADELERLRDARDRLTYYGQAIAAEVARRADARGRRRVDLGGTTFEVNAPTEDHYSPTDLLIALEPFVEAGVLARALVDELVVTPPPPPPPAPRVDRRRVAVLWRSDNRELLAALARVRRRVPTTRTAKIVQRATPATATEETPTR